MKLIGMMDSPYVRRVAISLRLMGIAHGHDQISVFRHMDAFRAVNPVIKAPTLVCDDGGTIMDSSLILDYAEALSGPGKGLMPRDLPGRQTALSLIGLALAACEKAVQIEYERKRPAERQYAPWLERVTAQLHAAVGELEKAAAGDHLVGGTLTQADVTVAVAWTWVRYIVPDVARAEQAPKLTAFTARMEAMPAFRETPLE